MHGLCPGLGSVGGDEGHGGIQGPCYVRGVAAEPPARVHTQDVFEDEADVVLALVEQPGAELCNLGQGLVEVLQSDGEAPRLDGPGHLEKQPGVLVAPFLHVGTFLSGHEGDAPPGDSQEHAQENQDLVVPGHRLLVALPEDVDMLREGRNVQEVQHGVRMVA